MGIKNKVFLLFLLAFPSKAFAQHDSTLLNVVDSRLKKAQAISPVEKVYLHLNKPTYNVGDTIWFKGYILVGGYHQPSALSGVLHVDLLGDKGKQIKSLLLQNKGGVSIGDFDLDKKLPSGLYRIRAYTNWMRNASPDYFFLKDIYINGDRPAVMPVRPGDGKLGSAPGQQSAPERAAEKIDIRFFPEGGQLVTGVRSKIAVKAVGTDGFGKAASGTIVDNDNKEVAFFTTTHAGMGIFALMPEAGKTYTAKVTAGNNFFSSGLPAAADKGFVLSINNSDSTMLTVKVATNEATVNEHRNGAFYLIAQSGGTIYYTTQGKLGEAVFSAVIPKNKFPSGIVQFTLIGDGNEPLNERVAFISNPEDLIKIDLNTDKTEYRPKEKVALTLTANNRQSKPAEGSFSVTVFHTVDGGTGEGNILSNVLLTSDLKGYIEDPDYYFTNVSDQTNADLDMLMLTQGYRRFEWKEILTGKQPEIIYQPEKYLTISGTVTDGKKAVPQADVSILSFADKSSVKTKSDEKGHFVLDSLNFTDSTMVAIQARRSTEYKNFTIALDNPVEMPTPTAALMKQQNDMVLQKEKEVSLPSTPAAVKPKPLSVLKNNTLLKEVSIKSRKNAANGNPPWMPEVTRSANLNGPGRADFIFGEKDVEGMINLLTDLMSRLPAIIRVPSGEPHYEFAYYFSRNRSKVNPPAIRFMIDGRLVNDEEVAILNAANVLTVEVLRSGSLLAIYGSEASGGLVIITTKNGNEGRNGPKVESMIVNQKFNGFYKAKEFYTPKYSPLNINTSDNRDAVYWDPNVMTNSNGTLLLPLEFYNSDLKGSYRIVVEGIDNDGNIGRGIYNYTVK